MTRRYQFRTAFVAVMVSCVVAPANSQEIHGPVVTVTAAESAAHRLPAAGITLNTSGKSMSGRKFASEGGYLVLSGPPGGPLGLSIRHIAETPAGEEAWRKLVGKHYSGRSPAFGSIGRVKLAGAKRPAFTFTTDKGQARSHHLMAAVGVPGSGGSILVDYYHDAGKSSTPSPKAMATHKYLVRLLGSISIRFEEFTARYQVGTLVDGAFTPLGMIVFDESNQGQLALTSGGEKALDLEKAWKEVAGLKVVHAKRCEPTEEGSELVGVEVARSSDDFPRAVMDYLLSEHGFQSVKM